MFSCILQLRVNHNMGKSTHKQGQKLISSTINGGGGGCRNIYVLHWQFPLWFLFQKSAWVKCVRFSLTKPHAYPKHASTALPLSTEETNYEQRWVTYITRSATRIMCTILILDSFSHTGHVSTNSLITCWTVYRKNINTRTLLRRLIARLKSLEHARDVFRKFMLNVN